MTELDLDQIPIERGANGPVELEDGGTVHLYRPPMSKWRIRFYERGGQIVLRGNARMLEWLEARPESWRDLEFNTAKAAAIFVQNQVRRFRIPAAYFS